MQCAKVFVRNTCFYPVKKPERQIVKLLFCQANLYCNLRKLVVIVSFTAFVHFLSHSYTISSALVFLFIEIPLSCHVRLPRDDRLNYPYCATLRKHQTTVQRNYFKLTTPVGLDDINTDYSPIFPTLDQGLDDITSKAMFGNQDAEWFSNYYGMVRALNSTSQALVGMMGTSQMKDLNDYKTVYGSFIHTVTVIL